MYTYRYGNGGRGRDRHTERQTDRKTLRGRDKTFGECQNVQLPSCQFPSTPTRLHLIAEDNSSNERANMNTGPFTYCSEKKLIVLLCIVSKLES